MGDKFFLIFKFVPFFVFVFFFSPKKGGASAGHTKWGHDIPEVTHCLIGAQFNMPECRKKPECG
jgi:hypothetical protein